jgi:NodT family efflux transporter outer membrane factor (OMF) lipoprotein
MNFPMAIRPAPLPIPSPCSRLPLRAAALAALALLGGCAVGPSYHRPTIAVPADFKEAAGWKQAAPSDAVPRGRWWERYQDPALDDLETQVTQSNLTLQQDAANYEAAREVARSDRAGFLPPISLSGSAERSQSPAGRSVSSSTSTASSSSSTGTGTSSSTTAIVTTVPAPAPVNNFSASLGTTWTPDFWGRVRRQTEADVAAAQASAADLANGRLATQAALAQDYIELRAADEKKRLLENASGAYARTLKISQNKYAVGVSGRSDILSAQAQLDSTRAQALDTGVQRAELEHAIAILLGRAPADFALASRAAFDLPVPDLPRQMPADLLERRPDIAAAERAVAQANAKVGVQTAAYYPNITLSAEGGFEGSVLRRLIEAPNRFWSIGSNLSETLLDWGQRRAELQETKAQYHGSVASYRLTVLTAFGQVEDNLAGLRILADEAQIQDAAVREAAQATQIATNEYSAGTVDYTTVVTTQVTELNDRESALAIRLNRLNSSVALIEALGGDWQASDLPTSSQVTARRRQAATAIAAPQ